MPKAKREQKEKKEGKKRKKERKGKNTLLVFVDWFCVDNFFST